MESTKTMLFYERRKINKYPETMNNRVLQWTIVQKGVKCGQQNELGFIFAMLE